MRRRGKDKRARIGEGGTKMPKHTLAMIYTHQFTLRQKKTANAGHNDVRNRDKDFRFKTKGVTL